MISHCVSIAMTQPMIRLSSKITSRRRPRGPGCRRVRRAHSSPADLAWRRAAGGVGCRSPARIPSSPPMINKPAVIATISVTENARCRSGRAGKITTKGEQLRLELSIGKVSCRLATTARCVVGEMCNRPTMLDRTSNLPDLRHIPATGAALPRLVDKLHIDEKVDVVGDLAVRLLDRKHTTLRNARRQTIHGRFRRVRMGRAQCASASKGWNTMHPCVSQFE